MSDQKMTGPDVFYTNFLSPTYKPSQTQTTTSTISNFDQINGKPNSSLPSTLGHMQVCTPPWAQLVASLKRGHRAALRAKNQNTSSETRNARVASAGSGRVRLGLNLDLKGGSHSSRWTRWPIKLAQGPREARHPTTRGPRGPDSGRHLGR